MPEWGLTEPFLEWVKSVGEERVELVSLVLWEEEDGRIPVAPRSSSSPSTSSVTFCLCFSAAFWKKDWMVPGCLHVESFFSSEGGWVEDWVVEKRLWVEATSLEKKPAIPPADGASLNLLAEMCSRVRGGLLGTWCKTQCNESHGISSTNGFKYLTVLLYSNYHAAWWFPAVLRLLIMAKLSLDSLVAS